MKQDHIFLVKMANRRQPVIAFCDKEGCEKEEARKKIERVLKHEKNIECFQALYLGVLDYTDVDESIKGQLSIFEKFPPVWLLN